MAAPVVDPTQPRFGCYVGNIDRSITVPMFREMFSACGPILDCSLNGNEEAPFRYGFIDFATEDDRARALKYNGFTFAGRKLKVMISRGNVGKPDGYSNSSGGNAGGSRPDRESHGGGRYEGGGGGGGRRYNHHNSNSNNGGGQQATQLLLQLISQGMIDVRNLTPEQQQQVVAMAMDGAASASPAPAPSQSVTPPVQMAPPQQPPQQMMPAANPMMMAQGAMMPPQQQGYMMPPQQQGGYPQPNMWMPQGPGMYNPNAMPPQNMGRPQHVNQEYQRPPVNPLPSEETLKRRELQRKQFFDVVREQTEKYQKKYGAKTSKKDHNQDQKSDASSRSSSDNDDDEKP